MKILNNNELDHGILYFAYLAFLKIYNLLNIVFTTASLMHAFNEQNFDTAKTINTLIYTNVITQCII